MRRSECLCGFTRCKKYGCLVKQPYHLVEKVCFFKKVLVLNPYPQTPFPRERLCMLGWLCIVQSLGAYTPGIRAGAECGATAPRPCRGLRPKPHFQKLYRFIDSLKYGCLVKQPYFIKILIEKSVFFCNSLSLRNAIYGADGSTEMTAYAL